MAIYFMLIILVSLMWGISVVKSKYSNILMKLTFVLLFIIEAFRASSVGTDTAHYVQIFKEIGMHDWGYIFKIGNVEWGYALYNKILYMIFPYSQAVIICNSLIVLVLFFRFIYKESPNKWMSIYLFITLLYYINTFNAVRQYIAIGIVLSNIHLIRERKLVKYSIVVAVASTFHSSMIIMWGLYFASYIKITYKKIAIALICGYLLYVNYNWLEQFMLKHITKKAYLNHLLYNNVIGNGRTFLVAFMILIFGICFYKQAKQKFNDMDIYFYAAAFASLFYLFATKFYLMIRVAETFAVFFIIFIPKILLSIKNDKMRQVIKLAVLSLCLCHYCMAICMNLMQGTVPYAMFGS